MARTRDRGSALEDAVRPRWLEWRRCARGGTIDRRVGRIRNTAIAAHAPRDMTEALPEYGSAEWKQILEGKNAPPSGPVWVSILITVAFIRRGRQ